MGSVQAVRGRTLLETLLGEGWLTGADFAPFLTETPQRSPRSVAVPTQLGLQESNHSGFVYAGRALLLDMLAALLGVDATYASEGIPLPV